jgi:hypothetical protein
LFCSLKLVEGSTKDLSLVIFSLFRIEHYETDGDHKARELQDKTNALEASWEDTFNLAEQVAWDIKETQEVWGFDDVEALENNMVNFRMRNMAFTLNRDFCTDSTTAKADAED